MVSNVFRRRISFQSTLTLNTSPATSDLSCSSSEDEVQSIRCKSCFIEFGTKKSFKQHNCNFRFDDQFFLRSNIVPVILKRPKNWKETLAIIGQLSLEDQVKLCRLQHWCLPSLYPFVFPHQLRAGKQGGKVPVIESMTAGKR